MHDYKLHLENLLSHATPEGGWGYSPDQAAHLEPTCLALLALAAEPETYRAAINKGLSVVQRAANADGAFRFPEDREELVWPTALVLFLSASGIYAEADPARTVARLVSWESRKPDEAQSKEIHDIDVGLMGWPWAENNFAWVEPTSWACLALRRAGYGDHVRVQEGLRLLVNRAFEDGGINYGNRMVLGKRTEPIPGPTSLMLLALQGHGHEPRVAAAVAYLLKQALASEDVEHLCWAKL
ncbi:MAG TPA: hypothetical protein VGY58_06335, partial [Gemmataceae bacterium]|nr:hypothetical protein [Gemmataceae bacterium]